jgi:hypothetical protein
MVYALSVFLDGAGGLNIFNSNEKHLGFLRGDHFGCTELNMMRICHEKWNGVDKHDVTSNCHFTVSVHTFNWNVYMFSVNMCRGGPGGLPFKRPKIGSKDILSRNDAASADWAVR